jgi:EAL domain-containing protein (putative c-di-GMP-specific phosphodiesterase class I)/GGDEF domain-containing protein
LPLDSISGLPNRQKFTADFSRLRAPDATLVMVTLADARHFNEILRALGHEWAEEFIREGAARVFGLLPPGAVLYHVSVLSFTFVLTGDLAPMIDRLIDAFKAPIFCQDVPVVSRAGIGIIACANFSAADALRAGLVAAQDSRGTAQGWAGYDPSRDTAHRRAFIILTQFAAACAASDQLALQFQPKLECASGRPVGAEALLRWRHPTLGAISPAEFIPLAEATDHVHQLTDWVLERALAQSAAWARDGLDLTMAVNVSPHNLAQTGFAETLLRKLDRHRVPAANIELEFTEGALASNNETVIAELARLRREGVNIALDDFGTGFSNLGYLSRLPANIIKIDRSLITPITAEPRAAAVVQSLITLAHHLDYRVVAEGIETADVYALLKSWHCNEAQGFYLSRPLTPDAFATFLATNGSIAPAPARASHVKVHDRRKTYLPLDVSERT